MSDRIDYRYNAEERVKLALSLPQSENEVPALVVAQIATAEAVLALVDATRAADTIDALVKERDALMAQGSCWDEGPQFRVPPGECGPMPPKCELPHGHGGAHRSGRAKWMRRDSYNSVVGERDALAAVVEKVWNIATASTVYPLSGDIRIALSAVPADALAEHDARLIEGLAEKWDWDAVPAAAPPVRFWLESQASLIREGAQP